MFILLNMSNLGCFRKRNGTRSGLYILSAPTVRGIYRFCGVKTHFRMVVALNELYPTTLIQKPPITTKECSRLKVRLRKQRNAGSCFLAVTGATLKCTTGNSMLQRKVVVLKQQLIVAEQQRQHFLARIEANNSLVELEYQLQQVLLD